jgi:hypothetical protein
LVPVGLQGGVNILRSILTGPSAMQTEERTVIEAWAAEHHMTFEQWEAGETNTHCLIE